MGSHSYGSECPNCHESMNCWNDTHSFEVGGECLNCGYTFWTETGFKSFEELNELREEAGLKLLTKKEYEALK